VLGLDLTGPYASTAPAASQVADLTAACIPSKATTSTRPDRMGFLA